MAEETEGAIGGIAQGASTGAMFGPVGAVIGGVVGGVAGFMSGRSNKKKRREAEERRRQAVVKMTQMIHGRRMRANEYLSEEEQFKDQLLEEVAGNYIDMKTGWELLGDDQKKIINSQFGDVMGEIDNTFKTQLGLSDEMVGSVNKQVEDMRNTYVPALKKDIEANEATRLEFGETVDKAMGNITEVQDTAKTALENLQSTGRTAGYDNRVAKLKKSFQEAGRNFEKYNPNLEGKAQQKLSNMFKSAMAEGDLSAQDEALAFSQEGQLRREIADSSNAQIRNAIAKQQGMQTSANTDVAQAELSFDETQLQNYKEGVLREMGLEGQAGLDRMNAIVNKYNSMAEVEQAVAQGILSAQDSAYLQKIGALQDFQQAKQNVMNMHMNIDKEVQALYAGSANTANTEANAIRERSNKFMQSGLDSFAKTVAGGGFNFPKDKPKTAGNNTGLPNPGQYDVTGKEVVTPGLPNVGTPPIAYNGGSGTNGFIDKIYGKKVENPQLNVNNKDLTVNDLYIK